MVVTCGIDFGVKNLRIVLMSHEKGSSSDLDRKILGKYTFIINHKTIYDELEKKYKFALEKTGLTETDHIAITGFGSKEVKFADMYIFETVCHASGAVYLFPNTRTVLTLGAMRIYAMSVEPDSRIKKFKYNSRCASASGIFLENTSRHLEIDINDMGKLSKKAESSAKVSNLCAILGGIDIVNSISKGIPIENIIRGAHDAVVDRAIPMLKNVGLESELTLTGGVAKNEGVVQSLQERIEKEGKDIGVNVHSDLSPYAGAIGAALLGGYRVASQRKREQ